MKKIILKYKLQTDLQNSKALKSNLKGFKSTKHLSPDSESLKIMRNYLNFNQKSHNFPSRSPRTLRDFATNQIHHRKSRCPSKNKFSCSQIPRQKICCLSRKAAFFLVTSPPETWLTFSFDFSLVKLYTSCWTRKGVYCNLWRQLDVISPNILARMPQHTDFIVSVSCGIFFKMRQTPAVNHCEPFLKMKYFRASFPVWLFSRYFF